MKLCVINIHGMTFDPYPGEPRKTIESAMLLLGHTEEARAISILLELGGVAMVEHDLVRRYLRWYIEVDEASYFVYRMKSTYEFELC